MRDWVGTRVWSRVVGKDRVRDPHNGGGQSFLPIPYPSPFSHSNFYQSTPSLIPDATLLPSNTPSLNPTTFNIYFIQAQHSIYRHTLYPSLTQTNNLKEGSCSLQTSGEGLCPLGRSDKDSRPSQDLHEGPVKVPGRPLPFLKVCLSSMYVYIYVCI